MTRRSFIAADHSRLDGAARDLLRVLGLLPKQEARAKQMRPDVEAQDFQGPTGGREHWCDPHQQAAELCRRAGLVSWQRVVVPVEGDDGEVFFELLLDDQGEPVLEERPCEGVLVDRPDPAGDAAVAHEVFLEKVRAFVTSEAIVIEHVGKMRAAQKWFLREDPTDEALERLAEVNQVACDRHLRFGFVRRARSKKGSRVRIGRSDRFVFDTPQRLCDWCEELAQEEHRLATEREIRDHVAGKRRKKEDRNPSPRRAHA